MNPYTTALTLLSRRELSARQLRDRLLRRHFPAPEVDAVIDRLVADRTVDDRRVALASARMAAEIKGRGRRRVLESVKQLGVSPEIAAAAVAEVFGEIDEETLLDRALARRLKDTPLSALDAKGKARLVRQLVTQGFDAAAVFGRLRRKGLEPDE